jgi:hypothetical protein
MVFAKPKVKLKLLRRRDKRVQKYKKRSLRYHQRKVEKAYDYYYKGAI